MLTQLSDFISLSSVALTEFFVVVFFCFVFLKNDFFVADEGFYKRPLQHPVFHPLCEEKSLAAT